MEIAKDDQNEKARVSGGTGTDVEEERGGRVIYEETD